MGEKREPKIPRSALVVAISAATLGIIYGYDQSNIAWANLYFQPYFGIDDAAVQSLVAAVVWGEFIGALTGGIVINRIGRKPSMIAVAIGYALFCVLSALAVSPAMLWGARFFLGLTIGLSLIAVPIFVAESVPARIRGATLVAYQVAAVVGIIIGYAAALVLGGLSDSISWRLMLGIAALPALILLPWLLRLPETARWLVMKGRTDAARASLQITDPSADVDAELAEITQAISAEKGGRFSQMLHKPYLRATIFVVGLGFFIQITGINATVNYGPKIFAAMGFDTDTEQIILSGLVQCIALVSVLISMSVVDRWGRRPILLTGIAIMIVAQLLMVITFASQQGDTFTAWQTTLGFIGLAGINIGFVFGFGALVWVYSSESFPAPLRGYGSSAMLGADLFANIIIAQFFLTVLNTIGGAWSFGIFAILAAAAWLFVFRLAPETKGRQLEEIQGFWENGGTWPSEKEATR